MTSSSRKVVCMLRIKLPTKRVFRIFPILRTDGMAAFCNLFMERPSYITSVTELGSRHAKNRVMESLNEIKSIHAFRCHIPRRLDCQKYVNLNIVLHCNTGKLWDLATPFHATLYDHSYGYTVLHTSLCNIPA